VRRSARSLLGVAVATALGTQCGFDDLSDRLSPPADAAHDAALGVDADGCGPRMGLGAGSMIDERLAVTAAHVVAGSGRIEVHDTEGRNSSADVVSFDPDLDIAVLRLSEPIGVPIGIRADEASVDEVGVIAVPLREDDTFDAEIVEIRVLRAVNIRTTDIYLEAPVERAGFEIEAVVDPGDSGSLVVLPGGGVGVVWARSNQRDERAWAVDLPPELADDDTRSRLSDPGAPSADVGRCTRATGAPG
jgi:S1-C subfamily serine protease